MSILNVNQIQPVGSGQTVTISAANITASSSTITANTFSGALSSSGVSTFSDTVNVGAGKSIRLYGASSGYSQIVAAAGSASTTFTLPANGGSTSQYLQTNGAGVLSWASITTGKVLQVVTTDYTGLFSTSTANTWTQVSGLDCSITLASSSSKVLVIVSLGQVSSASDVGTAWDIRRDGTAILQGAAESSRIACSFKVGCYQASHGIAMTFAGIDSPGSSGSKTYQIYTRAQGGCTVYLNRTQNNEDSNDSYAARPASHLTLVEIAS